MMAALKVRVYNVRFGDAILITVPDRDQTGVEVDRRILIDVGNSLTTEGGADQVFEPVVKDILDELDGDPLDLYIMTHEHMDHIQGLPYAEKYHYPASDHDLRDRLQTQFAWLTASAAEDYYTSGNHPKAKKAKLQMDGDIEAIQNYLKTAGLEPDTLVETLLAINNPRSSKENVDYLRKLTTSPANTFYVHRETDLAGKHPFQEADFEIWAPEEDTSAYYGRYKSPSLGMIPPVGRSRKYSLAELYPPRGVDAGAFYNLVNARRSFLESLLSIDKAKNNTSLVFCLTWRGWRLLFPGDAEVRSWKTMRDKGALSPVHFLKVSHHGSHNGTPSESILEEILPVNRDGDQRERPAVVMTYEGTYNNVPDADTLNRIYDETLGTEQPRCDKLYLVNEDTDDLFVELEFPE